MAESDILAQLGIEVDGYGAESDVKEIIEKIREILNQTLGVNIDVGDIDAINKTLDETGTKLTVVFDNANNSIKQVSATIKDANNVTTKWVQNFEKLSLPDSIDINRLDEESASRYNKYYATDGRTSITDYSDLKNANELIKEYYSTIKQIQSIDTEKFSNWATVLENGINNLLPDMQNLKNYLQEAGVSFQKFSVSDTGLSQVVASYEGTSSKIQEIVNNFNDWQDKITQINSKKIDTENYNEIKDSVKETTNAIKEMYSIQNSLLNSKSSGSYGGIDTKQWINNLENAKNKASELIENLNNISGSDIKIIKEEDIYKVSNITDSFKELKSVVDNLNISTEMNKQKKEYSDINNVVNDVISSLKKLQKEQEQLIKYKTSGNSSGLSESQLRNNLEESYNYAKNLVDTLNSLTGYNLQIIKNDDISTIQNANTEFSKLNQEIQKFNDSSSLGQQKIINKSDIDIINDAVEAYKNLKKATDDYNSAYSNMDISNTELEKYKENVEKCEDSLRKLESATLSNGDAVSSSSDYTSKAAEIEKEYADKLNKTKDTYESVNSGINAHVESMSDAIAQSAIYAVSLDNIVNAMQSVVDTAKELDAAMTDIQLVTQMSNEEATNLMQSYTQIAKELGSTTVTVAESADEWLRQGASAEQANDLVRASTTLATVGAMDAEDATKALTAAINGYQKEMSDAMNIVDQLTELDLKFAASSGDIADGLSRVAAVGNQAGISLEKLEALLAVTQDQTQMSAETIGNA